MISKEILEALEDGKTIHCVALNIFYRKEKDVYEKSDERYHGFDPIIVYDGYEYVDAKNISFSPEEIQSDWSIVPELSKPCLYCGNRLNIEKSYGVALYQLTCDTCSMGTPFAKTEAECADIHNKKWRELKGDQS